ncbi:unnamed protein product [Timema podura]|uniref:Uncharacterized protein n=1 Tax=Timema podura TaxID=61482 RepID=A0ABN7P964_TIMPD|nr:unnamed protein product [Timema podura]
MEVHAYPLDVISTCLEEAILGIQSARLMEIIQGEEPLDILRAMSVEIQNGKSREGDPEKESVGIQLNSLKKATTKLCRQDTMRTLPKVFSFSSKKDSSYNMHFPNSSYTQFKILLRRMALQSSRNKEARPLEASRGKPRQAEASHGKHLCQMSRYFRRRGSLCYLAVVGGKVKEQGATHCQICCTHHIRVGTASGTKKMASTSLNAMFFRALPRQVSEHPLLAVPCLAASSERTPVTCRALPLVSVQLNYTQS